MKDLIKYIKEHDEEQNNQPLEGGCDIALAGEIFYYSERDENFFNRKKLMADQFRERLLPEQQTTDYILKTPIFNLYIRHLKEDYKNNVDENMKLNLSTEDDLRRQVVNSILLMIKNISF